MLNGASGTLEHAGLVIHNGYATYNAGLVM